MLTLIAGKTILILALTAHSTNICPCCSSSPCTAWSGPARCDHRGGEWRCCRRRRRRRRRSPHTCTASPSRGSRTCLSSRTRRRGSRAAGQRPSPGQTQSVLFGAEVNSGKVRGVSMSSFDRLCHYTSQTTQTFCQYLGLFLLELFYFFLSTIRKTLSRWQW